MLRIATGEARFVAVVVGLAILTFALSCNSGGGGGNSEPAPVLHEFFVTALYDENGGGPSFVGDPFNLTPDTLIFVAYIKTSDDRGSYRRVPMGDIVWEFEFPEYLDLQFGDWSVKAWPRANWDYPIGSPDFCQSPPMVVAGRYVGEAEPLREDLVLWGIGSGATWDDARNSNYSGIVVTTFSGSTSCPPPP